MAKKKKEIKLFTPAKASRMKTMLMNNRSIYSIAKELDLTPSVAAYHAKKFKVSRVTPIAEAGIEPLTDSNGTLTLLDRISSQEKYINKLEIKLEVMKELLKEAQ